jgi:hypothetical protein
LNEKNQTMLRVGVYFHQRFLHMDSFILLKHKVKFKHPGRGELMASQGSAQTEGVAQQDKPGDSYQSVLIFNQILILFEQ